MLFCFLAIGANSRPRNINEALVVANAFCLKNNSGEKSSSSDIPFLRLAYACNSPITTRSQNDALYYVFNKSADRGFVIVSGDDRAKNILGYSENGTFNIDSIPDALRSWLATYEKEISYLYAQSENVTNMPVIKVTYPFSSPYAKEIAPLLGKIKWNQGYPYNNLCPVINATNGAKAATGCVATAMAQVMRFHKYPAVGMGSQTYVPRNFTSALSVDFSKSVYDWENMSEVYDQNSTATQMNAVAKLMYDCGVSMEMNYGPSSGAVTTDMALAFITNFGYDSNLQYYTRDYTPYPEWIDLLKKELNASRPILYGGNATDVGHQFVCDGYNSLDLFHFNWGWGGRSDGYFEISALNPGSLGTGGGNSGGFNYNQDIVVGVQKAGATPSSPSYVFTIDYPMTSSVSSMGRTLSTSITVKRMFNAGISTLKGKRGLALYDKNGLVEVLASLDVTNCTMYSGWPVTTFPISIPQTVADGNYKLYSVYKGNNQSEWSIANSPVGIANCLNVAITSSSVKFSMPDITPKLTLNELTTLGNLYQNKTGEFKVKITNDGSEYYSLTAIYLVSVNDASVNQYVVIDPTDIPAGETKEFNLLGKVTVAPGDYYLYAAYDPQNNRFSVPSVNMLNANKIVKVLPTPTESPYLTLSSQINVPDNQCNDLTILNAQIKNTGGYFYDKLVAFIYSKADNSFMGNLDVIKVILDKNEEKSVTLKGYLSLAPNQYLATLMYWDIATNSWIALSPDINASIVFSSIDKSTDIKQNSTNDFIVYPNPAYNEIHFNSDELVKVVTIMDITGKKVYVVHPNATGEITVPLQDLNSGNYIIQIETDTVNKVSKFIKLK